MSDVGSIERKTQNRIVQFFRDYLDYKYLGNWQYRKNNRNVEPDYLHAFLKQEGYSDTLYEISKCLLQIKPGE